MKDDRTDAPSPPARPPQSPARQHLVHRRKRRSREQDCSRQPSHRGFPATASTAPDQPLQRSASSIPPQNHQENLSSARVFTHPGSRPVGRARSLVCRIPHPTTSDRRSARGIAGLMRYNKLRYTITSSAGTSSVGGTVRPSVLAVLGDYQLELRWLLGRYIKESGSIGGATAVQCCRPV